MSTAEKVYNRVMTRNPAFEKDQAESTIKHTGVNWFKYQDIVLERLDNMKTWRHEKAKITTSDGLTLRGSFFPAENDEKKVVIAFHGYTSDGITNNVGVADFFRREGFSILLPDARAHGKSDGKYIGFGCLDRYDVLKWIEWIINRCGEDIKLLLYGQSMGAATVSMASSFDELPKQVKCIISDSAFTSPEKMLTYFFKKKVHSFLITKSIVRKINALSKERGGYSLGDCDSSEEVKKAKVPILFIHGAADPFVPAFMCDEIYQNCTSPKHKVIFDGAAHIESYYSHTQQYEKELKNFMDKYF